jgi:hypothetical protein
MQPARPKKNKRSGQAMLTAVLTISGAILGATTVAGFLMVYQLRASTDSENSAKAVFAADSGVEWSLFDYYCGVGTISQRCPVLTGEQPSSSFSNGAKAVVTCSDANDNQTLCSDASDTVSAVSLGSSLNSRRAFAVMLTDSTSTDQ